MKVNNIFSKIPRSINKELFQTIISSKNVKIERIISNKHKTKDNYWYDQDKNEFVLLLEGKAELLLFPNKLIKMKKGDYLVIPKHKKHRVEKTSKDALWLTVFY